MSAKAWRNITIFVVLPTVATLTGFIMKQHADAHHGCSHRVPFVKYDYLRLRNKRYPWGDGNKTAFHNPEVNPLPDGYEDEL